MSSIADIRAAVAAAHQDVTQAAAQANSAAERFERAGQSMAAVAVDSSRNFDQDVQGLLTEAATLAKDAMRHANAGMSTANDYAQSL